MKKRAFPIKRAGTGIVLAFSLLAAGLLTSGVILRGETGLNLFVWGVLVTPLAIIAIFLRIGWPLISQKTETLHPKPLIKLKIFNRTAYSSTLKSAFLINMDASPTVEDEEADTEKPAYANPRHTFLANFNWETGEYDVARDMSGWYDPPYDLIKK